MTRLEALSRLLAVASAQGKLVIHETGNGWPATGEVLGDSGSVPVALYIGIMGESHRGRDSEERRFQNPGQDHPIEHSEDNVPLLLGLVRGEEPENDLWIGFDARRRLGKRTRFSMFAPIALIREGTESGWAVGVNASAEELLAFQAAELPRYVQFRFGAHPRTRAREHDMAEIAELLDGIRDLLGLQSIEELGQRVASKIAGTPSTKPETIWSQLSSIAERDRIIEADETLTWPTALAAAASFDERLGLMLRLWEELGALGPMPQSHEGFVERIYEHGRFFGREPQEGMEAAVLDIASRCESELDSGDLEVFLADGAPTEFFYESVRSYLESSSDPVDATKGEDDDEEDSGEADEDDAEEQAQPVNAIVDKLQVMQIFNLVSKGRLDIEPPWQRKDVWSLKRKRELVRSLILGIPLPSIILHRKDGRHSIIDGKQRLTAIMQFMQNEWKLPNYSVSPGNPLYEARGAFYSKPGKKSLSENARDTLEFRHIPALIFEDVPESRLRKIFELYNVAGMKLNAAEIRNAVYQSNPIHQVLYVLAGEGDGRLDLGIGGIQAQRAFAERLRAIYPGAKKRYQGVDFLARYLGYSRAVRRPGADQFRVPSTSSAINNFFDFESTKENPQAIARELVSVMDAAEQYFDLDTERLAFFVRNDRGQRQFNKLVSTTHMVAARFLTALIAGGVITESDASSAAEAVATPPPSKQQRATIWDYQARILIGLRDYLEVDPAALEQEWQEFFEKMEYCRLPEEVEA